MAPPNLITIVIIIYDLGWVKRPVRGETLNYDYV